MTDKIKLNREIVTGWTLDENPKTYLKVDETDRDTLLDIGIQLYHNEIIDYVKEFNELLEKTKQDEEK